MYMYDQSAPYVYFFSAEAKNSRGETCTLSGCISTHKSIHEDNNYQTFVDDVCKGRGLKPDEFWVTSLTPLKAPIAQRQWVGLTEEDRREALLAEYEQAQVESLLDCAREDYLLIEAKLKEKNS